MTNFNGSYFLLLLLLLLLTHYPESSYAGNLRTHISDFTRCPGALFNTPNNISLQMMTMKPSAVISYGPIMYIIKRITYFVYPQASNYCTTFCKLVRASLHCCFNPLSFPCSSIWSTRFDALQSETSNLAQKTHRHSPDFAVNKFLIKSTNQ